MEEKMEYALGCLPGKFDIRDYRLKKKVAMAIEYPQEFCCEKRVGIKFQGSVGSCHDAETQVLTRTGWKYFKDISKQDLLASVDPDTNTIIFEHPSEILSYEYSGKMITGKHTSLDFKVTPNHKMLVRTWDESKRTLSSTYSFIDADKLGCYGGFMSTFNYNGNCECSDDECIILEEEKLSNGNILPEIKINLHDWVQFIGIYLAEGTLCKSLTSKKTFAYRIQLAAVKERETIYIHELLEKLGVKANIHKKDRFVFSNKRIFKKLESYGLFGIKAKDKFVPDFIFDLDNSYIKDFLLGFGMGDGHQCKEDKWQYFTSSPLLAEQLQVLALLAGNWNKITTRPPRNAKFKDHIVPAENVLPSYTISTRVKPLSYTRKCNISSEDYAGTVYCATMPTYHTLITKRNENILVSGNCVAHSTAEILEYHEDGLMSTDFIYGIHKKLYGSDGPGMYLREALQIVHDYGDPAKEYCSSNTEVDKVYDIANKVFEDEAAMENAAHHRADNYAKLFTQNDIKYALMNYGPVLAAITWYDDNKCINGILKKGNLKSGGHAIVILGWDEDGFICQNSWGSWWGDQGYFKLPYNYRIDESYSFVPDGNKDDIIMPSQNTFMTILFKIINFIGNLLFK